MNIPKLPEKPRWMEATYLKPDTLVIKHDDFEAWYTEVFKDALPAEGYFLCEDNFVCNTNNYLENTHRALIINIQPIKEETAENLLKDLMGVFAASKLDGKRYDICINNDDRAFEILARAKSFLERKK